MRYLKLVCHLVYALLFASIFYSCNKNKDFSGDVILTGYAYLADSVSNTFSIPFAGQTLYLNNGDDTTTYIAQTITDLAGSFSISSLKDNVSYTLFTRFIKDGIEYNGAIKVEGGTVNKTIRTILNIYPHYTNGMVVTFTDVTGGVLPNLRFRYYTSSFAASFDSTKYAIADTVSDANGQFKRFNMVPNKYFFVSKDSFGMSLLKIFDSITVPASEIKKDTIILK